MPRKTGSLRDPRRRSKFKVSPGGRVVAREDREVTMAEAERREQRRR